MKWMIASDLHGSARYTRELTEAFDREEADRLLLLGDLLYHGPRNDLPDEYDPKRVIAMLNERKDSLVCVRGNCDAEVDQMVLEFPILADSAYLCADGLTVFATHGHIYHKNHLPPLGKGDILLHGHTHVPAWEVTESCTYLNPGSVSLPKAGSCRGYMILEDGRFTWKTLDGTAYHTFTPGA